MWHDFVIGFMSFLGGAMVGIIWKTIQDIKSDMIIQDAYEKTCFIYEDIIENRENEIERLKRAIGNKEVQS